MKQNKVYVVFTHFGQYEDYTEVVAGVWDNELSAIDQKSIIEEIINNPPPCPHPEIHAYWYDLNNTEDAEDLFSKEALEEYDKWEIECENFIDGVFIREYPFNTPIFQP